MDVAKLTMFSWWRLTAGPDEVNLFVGRPFPVHRLSMRITLFCSHNDNITAVCVNVAKFESPTVNNACVQNKISYTQHRDLNFEHAHSSFVDHTKIARFTQTAVLARHTVQGFPRSAQACYSANNVQAHAQKHCT